MSGGPPWRGPLRRVGAVAVGHCLDSGLSLDDEVEVWRAGDRPVPPTRDQVVEAMRRGRRSVPLQPVECPLPKEREDAMVDAVMALLSGGVPTEPEDGKR